MVIKFLRSIQLALVLIGYLAVTSALATLVPQGREAAYYTSRYSTAFSRLILTFGLDGFFRSAFFLLPAALFTVNLALCAAHRLAVRLLAGARRRFGPDLVHLGLLLLIAGGAVTLFGREERMVYLPEGDAVTLPGGSVLRARLLEYQEYPDGRPKDWLTTVEVSGAVTAGAAPADAARGTSPAPPAPRVFTIEVNRPLRVGRLKVYQSSFHRLPALAVEREGAGTSTLIPGHGLPTSGGGRLRYVTFESDAPGTREEEARGTAVFEEWRGGIRTGQKRLALGTRFEGYRLAGLKYFSVTGLHVVRDPGFPLVIGALLLAAGGLSLSVIQKAREEDNV